MRSSTAAALIAVFFFLLQGCASLTSSQRYARKDKSDADKEVVSNRYADKEKPQSKKDTAQVKKTPDVNTDDEEEFDSDEQVPRPQKNLDQMLSGFASLQNDPATSREVADLIDSIKMEIIRYAETPYKYGGNNMDGIDCSAFMQAIFTSVFKMNIPRTAREQFQIGNEIDRSELKFGDLIFFNTRRRVRPGHVGIYLGENRFAHASRTLGVAVSSLEEDYYDRKYMGARRIVTLSN